MDSEKKERRRVVLMGALLLIVNFALSVGTIVGLLFLIKYLFF